MCLGSPAGSSSHSVFRSPVEAYPCLVTVLVVPNVQFLAGVGGGLRDILREVIQAKSLRHNHPVGCRVEIN